MCKSIFRQSRPLFDDISLADTDLKDCATEFGSPSGHTQLSICNVFLILRYLTELHSVYFDANPLKRSALWLFSCIYLSVIGYSRIYNGRHTLDQVIMGALLGYWCYSFCWNIFRPFVFNEVIKVNSNHAKHFLYCWVLVSVYVG